MKSLAEAQQSIAREAWHTTRLQLRIFVVAGIRPHVPLKLANVPYDQLTPYQRAAIAQSAQNLVEAAGNLTALVNEPL